MSVALGLSRPLAAALATSSSTSAFTNLHRSLSQAFPADRFHSWLTTDHTHYSASSLSLSQSLSLWIQSALFSFPGHLTPDSSYTTPPESTPHPLEEDQPSAVASLSSALLDILPDLGILFAVPKNKPSKQRGKTRRVGFMLNRGIPVKRYRLCPECGLAILPNHICYYCFLNNKQLTRVTGWKHKSVFPWKDKVQVKPEEDRREWTAPQGVPDNRAWIATQAEYLYKRERNPETKRKRKHVSDMRREALRERKKVEQRSRTHDVNQGLREDIMVADEERAKNSQAMKAFDQEWAQKRREKLKEIENEMIVEKQMEKQRASQ